MNIDNKLKNIESEIQKLRRQLDQLAATHDFLDPQVIQLSQTLDKLITSHVKLSQELKTK